MLCACSTRTFPPSSTWKYRPTTFTTISSSHQLCHCHYFHHPKLALLGNSQSHFGWLADVVVVDLYQEMLYDVVTWSWWPELLVGQFCAVVGFDDDQLFTPSACFTAFFSFSRQLTWPIGQNWVCFKKFGARQALLLCWITPIEIIPFLTLPTNDNDTAT